MRIKHPLQTLQKTGSLCLALHHRHPLFSLCTHFPLPALTKRRKTRKFNNAFERQDYLRRRLHCYAASEISCALLSVCSHHIPPFFHSSFPSTPLTWLKTALKKHIKTLLWCHGRQLTPGVQNYRLQGMWHILDGLGDKCACACARRGAGSGGWVHCLFVLKRATSLMKWCRGRFETTHFCQLEK